jgi:hypothetical protein
MANPEHFDSINQGVDTWNEWREENPDIKPDLSESNLIIPSLDYADLCDVNFYGTDLTGVDLHGADLEGANLENANMLTAVLDEANLVGANFTNANLRHVDFIGTNLKFANFFMADLKSTDFSRANLSSASFFNANLRASNLMWSKLHGANFNRAILIWSNFEEAIIQSTIFSETDLSKTKGLDKVISRGPCTIDQQTLIRSKNLPERFLRDCGFSDSFIKNIPTLLESLGLSQKYSCFINYSEQDEALAQKVHNDLQERGVRCWFAPKIDNYKGWYVNICGNAIRDNEKVVLLISKESIKSEWLKADVEKALKREKRMNAELRTELKDKCQFNFEDFQKAKILFPIILDQEGKDAFESWVKDLDLPGVSTDFYDWGNRDNYQKSFASLMKELEIEYPIANFDQN